MDNVYKMNVNFNLMVNEDEKSVMTLTVKDNQDMNFSVTEEGSDIIGLFDQLGNSALKHLALFETKKKEPEKTQEELLMEEIARLKEENARLEHRLHDTVKEPSNLDKLQKAYHFDDEIVQMLQDFTSWLK